MSARHHLIKQLHHTAWLRDQSAPQNPEPDACRRNAEALRSLARYLDALPARDDAVQVLQLLFGPDWRELKAACTTHEATDSPVHLLQRYRRDEFSPPSDTDHRAFLAQLLQAFDRQRAAAPLLIPEPAH